MKKIFYLEICLITTIGMFIVLAVAFPNNHQSKSVLSLDDNHSQGQVIAASNEIVTYTEISPKDVFDLINKNDSSIVLVDVSNVFKSGHIPKAINIPFKNIDKIAFGMDKNKTYIIYCRNNTDSLIALQKLVNAGFKKLFHLSGGYNNWVSSKYKIVR